MKNFAAERFSRSMRSLAGSYLYVRRNFAEEFLRLDREGLLAEGGVSQKIWETGSRFVLKVPLKDGSFAVFKKYRRIEKPLKFMLRPSPCGFEAYNFQLMAEAGLPMPRLLAVGDIRRFFLLKTAFIMTEFAAGFRDGRDFRPGKVMAERKELRDEFIMRNFRLLARCHDAGIVHRGFTPANLLYKVRSSPDAEGNMLELVWIDVASCRRRPMALMNLFVPHDVWQFFRFFDFTPEEKKSILSAYCEARKNHPPSLARLLARA